MPDYLPTPDTVRVWLSDGVAVGFYVGSWLLRRRLEQLRDLSEVEMRYGSTKGRILFLEADKQTSATDRGSVHVSAGAKIYCAPWIEEHRLRGVSGDLDVVSDDDLSVPGLSGRRRIALFGLELPTAMRPGGLP